VKCQERGAAKGENRHVRGLAKGEPAFNLPSITPSLLLSIWQATLLLGEVQVQLDSKVLERELRMLPGSALRKQEEKL